MGEYSGFGRRSLGVVILMMIIFAGIVIYMLRCNLPISSGSCNQVAPPEPTATPAGGGSVIVFFFTSDTKANWINDVTEDFNNSHFKIASGQEIYVDVTQGDSGDLKEGILDGTMQPTVFSPGEMSWVNEANEDWKLLHNQELLNTTECQPTAVAGIGFGMWKPMAEAMGWPDKPIGWSEIMALASDPNGWGRYGQDQWGQFKFGHTHPLESNTGRLAILSLAYWSLGRTDGLTPQMVKSPEVVTAVQMLEQHTYHYGASSRQLLARMVELGPGYLSAATTSETNLLVTNDVNKNNAGMWSPLVFIAPADGVFWSDNPYCILETEWVTDEQREAAEVYRDYLLQDDQQRIAMEIHGLRPTNPDVALGPLIDLNSGTDPNDTPENIPTLATVSGSVAKAVEDVFIQAKKKALIVIVLDTSASMNGSKIKGATAATADFLTLLSEKDKDDEVYVLSFNSEINLLTPYGRVEEVGEELRQKVSTLYPEGGTALYDALCRAADLIRERQLSDKEAGEERLPGIIVLSDGEDTSSKLRTESDVFNICIPSGDELDTIEEVQNIPVYAIAYGVDANPNFLTRIANHSHGRFYTADETNLSDIYNAIAYEQ